MALHRRKSKYFDNCEQNTYKCTLVVKMIFETADQYFLIGIFMKCIFQPIKNDIIGQISTNAGSEIALQHRNLGFLDIGKAYRIYGC